MANYSRGSRFLGGTFSEFDDEQTVFPPFYDFSNVQSVGSFQISVATEYRPDLISFQVYGQSNLGWYIMLYNQIDHVKDLKEGVTLSIPPKGLVT